MLLQSPTVPELCAAVLLPLHYLPSHHKHCKSFAVRPGAHLRTPSPALSPVTQGIPSPQHYQQVPAPLKLLAAGDPWTFLTSRCTSAGLQ